METNNDPTVVVMSREHFDWILEMAGVGVHEWQVEPKMKAVLAKINEMNRHLPSMEGWEC